MRDSRTDKSDLTVTIGRRTYTLTRVQAYKLVGGFANFHLNDIWTRTGRSPRARKRAYLPQGRGRGSLRSGTVRRLAELGLISPPGAWGSYYNAITDRGMVVAEALWPLLYPEERQTWAEFYEEQKVRQADDDAEQDRLLKQALTGFTGIQDGNGKAMTTRLKEHDLRNGFQVRLDLEDVAAIGRQITNLKDRA